MKPIQTDGQVMCFSGHTYAQRPITFSWQGELKTVGTVLAEWQIPQGKQFMVKTQEDEVFILKYDSELDQWQVNLPSA